MNDETISLHLDNQPYRVPAGTTLARLVADLGHAPTDVATAINGRFVPRGDRASLALASNDAVLLFKPIVGG
jgi:sulfur carrier protein